MTYFSGQGRAYISPVVAGAPGPFRFVGDASELQVQMQTTTLEHKEHVTGKHLEDLRLITEEKASVSFTLQEFNAENLALALFGTSLANVGGSVSAEALPAGLAAGDFARLANGNVSAVVVTDSATSPAALALGTDYSIESAPHGTLGILNVGSYVQPFNVAYTYGPFSSVPMFNTAQQEYWLKFDGLNTADSESAVLVELYRIVLDPLDVLDLISDELLDMKLSGSALYDSTKTGDAILGPFGRVVLL